MQNAPVLIIPTLGRPHLRQMLDSIDMPVRLLVIANGGDPWDHLEHRDWDIEPWVIDLPHNIGYAAAVNLGVKCHPHEPYWIIANDDVILAPGDLQRLVEAEGDWVGINDWSVQKLTAAAVERVGWMDENYHPAYCDDADYERRVDLAGLTRRFIHGSTTHASSACLRDHRDDNDRTYPANVQYHIDKWGVGVRASGGYDTPFDQGHALLEGPSLHRLRAQAWRDDRDGGAGA